MKKKILFDLDGTLTDSGEGIINCAVYALQKFALPIPPREELRKFVGPPLHESFMRCGVPADRAEKRWRCTGSVMFLWVCLKIRPTPASGKFWKH